MDSMMNKQQLKLRELKIISVIAASENISHAALALGIAQANVSKYLADFESKIGLKVFDRTTRQLTLTPFGAALLPYINTCLDKNNQLTNFIADYKHEKSGRVTVYAPTGITSYLSKNVIANISNIGDIILTLKTSNLERKAFYEGVDFPDDCDIMVTYAPPKDQTLVASFLAKYAVSAYASREYLNKNPINHPQELENHSCILIDSMMIDDANIWRFASNGGVDIHEYRVKGNYVCDNTQAALDLARNHLGIVFAPDTTLKQDIQSGTLFPCFPEQHQWWLDLVVIFRKREYQPWRVQYVLDELLNEIRHQLAHVIQKSPEQACQLTDQ